jgi:hypothetical protein
LLSVVDVPSAGPEEQVQDLRRPLIVWTVGLPVCAALAYLAARAGVQPGPPGIEDHGQDPRLGAVAWAFGAISLLWGVAVFLVPLLRRVHSLQKRGPEFRIRHGRADLVCAALLIVAMSSCTAYYAASPGCGEPRASIVEPLPAALSITDERTGEPIAGPQKSRFYTVRSETLSQHEVWELLVDHYTARGWPLESSHDDDYAYSELDEWVLNIVSRSFYTDGDDQTVEIELRHTPTSDRGCINW